MRIIALQPNPAAIDALRKLAVQRRNAFHGSVWIIGGLIEPLRRQKALSDALSYGLVLSSFALAKVTISSIAQRPARLRTSPFLPPSAAATGPISIGYCPKRVRGDARTAGLSPSRRARGVCRGRTAIATHRPDAGEPVSQIMEPHVGKVPAAFETIDQAACTGLMAGRLLLHKQHHRSGVAPYRPGKRMGCPQFAAIRRVRPTQVHPAEQSQPPICYPAVKSSRARRQSHAIAASTPRPCACQSAPLAGSRPGPPNNPYKPRAPGLETRQLFNRDKPVTGSLAVSYRRRGTDAAVWPHTPGLDRANILLSSDSTRSALIGELFMVLCSRAISSRVTAATFRLPTPGRTCSRMLRRSSSTE